MIPNNVNASRDITSPVENKPQAASWIAQLSKIQLSSMILLPVCAVSIWIGSIVLVLWTAKISSFRIAWAIRIIPVLARSTITGRIKSRSVRVIVWESSMSIPRGSLPFRLVLVSTISCGMRPTLDARFSALSSLTLRSTLSVKSMSVSADRVSYGTQQRIVAKWTAQISGTLRQE